MDGADDPDSGPAQRAGDALFRLVDHVNGYRMPGPDGSSVFDCGSYVDAMRDSLLAFDRNQFSTTPSPIDADGDMGQVDACSQSGVSALTRACQLTSSASCIDPNDCCRSPGGDMQSMAQRARIGHCFDTNCPAHQEAVSNGKHCICVDFGSQNEPGFEHPLGIFNPARPGVGMHRIDLGHPHVVDALVATGDAMSSALDWCTDAGRTRAAFLRQEFLR